MDNIIATFVTAFGLAIGSFLNVCVYRIPKGMSISHPRSHCPQCHHYLSFWENIPVISFLILKGQCRECGGKISFQYPLVELMTGVLFWAAFTVMGLNLYLLLSVLFISLLILISIVDIKIMLIPNSAIYFGVILGLILMALEGVSHLQGGAMMLFLFLGIRIMGQALFHQEAMGMGDLKLAGIIGLFLGWKLGMVAAFLSFFLAAIFILPLLGLGKITVKQQVPFGPFLTSAAIITLFWGQAILDQYWSLFNR